MKNKIDMRTSTLLIASAGAALLLWSCNVDDPIYNTDHPDKGKITLTMDWSEMGTGITKPASYTISVAGYSTALSGDCNTFNKLFDPGTYAGIAYTDAEKITVSGTTATVESASGVVDPSPGWLFTAHDPNVTITKDVDHQYTAVMQQQVRQLTLTIMPTGDSADKIESITATLSGIAGTLDFTTDTHSTPSNVTLTFTKIVSGVDEGKWVATARLLGVMGAEQKLSGTITFTGGNPIDQQLESDLGTALAGFNTDKKTPLTLGGTSVETPSEVGFTAAITGWTTVQDNGGIAW